MLAAHCVALRCTRHVRPLAALPGLRQWTCWGGALRCPCAARCAFSLRPRVPGFRQRLLGSALHCPALRAARSAFGRAFPGFRRCTCRQRLALPCAARCLHGFRPSVPGCRQWTCRGPPYVAPCAVRCTFSLRPRVHGFASAPVGSALRCPSLRAACPAFGRACLAFASRLAGGAPHVAPALCAARSCLYRLLPVDVLAAPCVAPALRPARAAFGRACTASPVNWLAAPCIALCCAFSLWPRLPSFCQCTCSTSLVGCASRRRALHAARSAFGRACMALPVELLATPGVALRCVLRARLSAAHAWLSPVDLLAAPLVAPALRVRACTGFRQ